MIILTGGAGFIGSNVLRELNRQGYTDITIVDHDVDEKSHKWKNLVGVKFTNFVDIALINKNIVPINSDNIEAIIHIGAKNNTMTLDLQKMVFFNLYHSQYWTIQAQKYDIPFIYASSAAVYGDLRKQSLFREDNDELSPLNPYAMSKLLFDRWLQSKTDLKRWVGFRFFNVYGEREFHKGKSASLIHQWLDNLLDSQWHGDIRIFRSEHEEIRDGEYARDFIYVGDIARIIVHTMERMIKTENILTGIFNVGTGNAITIKGLAGQIIDAYGERTRNGLVTKIEYEYMPHGLKYRYQPYTCANMEKSHKSFSTVYTPLCDGIEQTAKFIKDNREFYLQA